MSSQFLYLGLKDVVGEETEYQEVRCEILSHKNGCINKIQRMAISIDMPISNGENLSEPYTQTGCKQFMIGPRGS